MMAEREHVFASSVTNIVLDAERIQDEGVVIVVVHLFCRVHSNY